MHARYYTDPYLFNCKYDPVQNAIYLAESRAIAFAISKGVMVVAAGAHPPIPMCTRSTKMYPQYPNNGAIVIDLASCIVPAFIQQSGASATVDDVVSPVIGSIASSDRSLARPNPHHKHAPAGGNENENLDTVASDDTSPDDVTEANGQQVPIMPGIVTQQLQSVLQSTSA